MMKTCVAVLVLVSSGVAMAGDVNAKLPSGEKDRIRAVLVATMEARLKENKAEMAQLRKRKAGKLVAKLADDVAKIESGDVLIRPHLDPTITPKDFGVLSPFKIINVIGKSEALVVLDHDDFDKRQFLWLRGVNVSGVVTGERMESTGSWYATGTATYKTAIGGSKTVVVLEPIDLLEFAPPATKTTKKK